MSLATDTALRERRAALIRKAQRSLLLSARHPLRAPGSPYPAYCKLHEHLASKFLEAARELTRELHPATVIGTACYTLGVLKPPEWSQPWFERLWRQYADV